MTDNIRIYRPPLRKRRRRKPKTGQERVERAIQAGEADGRKWALRKAERGQLYIEYYFSVYFEAFERAARQVVREVEDSLPPPIVIREDGLMISTTTGETLGVAVKENSQSGSEEEKS
jgi:hypothetical protein